MLPNSSVMLAFVARFATIFAIYSIPFRPIGEAYARVAAAAGNVALRFLDLRGATLYFNDAGDSVGLWSRGAFGMELVAHAMGRLPVRVPIDLRSLTYLPTAAFIALVVAAPIWQKARGAVVLGAGLALLQIFLCLSVALPLVLFFANPAPLHLVDLGPATTLVCNVIYRSLVAPPGMAFIVPGLLFLLLLWIAPASRFSHIADRPRGGPRARRARRVAATVLPVVDREIGVHLD